MKKLIFIMMLTLTQFAYASSRVDFPIPEGGILYPKSNLFSISLKDYIIGGGTQYKVTCHVSAPEAMKFTFATNNGLQNISLNGKHSRDGILTATAEAGDNVVTFSGISNPGWDNYTIKFQNLDNTATATIVSCSADILDD